MLSESKERVLTLLRDRRRELETVAEALIAQETLDAAQIRELCDRVAAAGAAEAPVELNA